MRLVDEDMDRMLCIFKPKNVASSCNGLVVGSMSRVKISGKPDSWSFCAIGLGVKKEDINAGFLLKLEEKFKKDSERELTFKSLVVSILGVLKTDYKKVGNSNAGKTSLIKYYVDGEFTADYKPTIGKF